MPHRAPSPCSRPGCGKTTTGRYCHAHRQQAHREDRQRRGSASARGYGKRWAEYSRAYRKAHPWCRRCEDRGVHSLSEMVDHITPVTGPDDPRFWDPTNHQALCNHCHGEKTVVDDRLGLHNPRRP